MSALLGIVLCAALFAAFGLLHAGRRPKIGCDACGANGCTTSPECPHEHA